MLIAICHWLPE